MIRLSLTIILAALLSAVATQAQTLPHDLSEIHTAATPLSRTDQWHNLKLWVALTFDNSNVIDMQDPERGTMVIKWSCPIKMKSDCISATATATYVIDVRDGKYRLQRINPRIVFQFTRPDIYAEIDPSAAELANADFRLINGIANRLFEGSYEWPANEQYEEIIDAYREVLASIPQYKTDRDKERGKISDEWRKAERNWQMVRTPYVTLKQLDAAMSESLDKALKHNDDF